MLTDVKASESQSEERPSWSMRNGKKNSFPPITHKRFEESPKRNVQQKLRANA